MPNWILAQNYYNLLRRYINNVSTLRAPLLFNMLSVIVFTHLATMVFAAHEMNNVSQQKKNSLMDMDIEKLMSLEVTTVSRRSQRLAEVASAVFVITQDDIRRSGVTSIPEALRMVPGVEVARTGTDKWAIGIRGLNGRFADKLQVLMDGRSVYNPLFAGVQWEQQDTLLEDIERIEVIRGPNASVWGANAVNGVINIITKKAAQTQGLLLTAGVALSVVFLAHDMGDQSMITLIIVFIRKDSHETR